MKFDINKIYTAVNADEIKVGSIGIFADAFDDLRRALYNNYNGHKGSIREIRTDNYRDRFVSNEVMQKASTLFYLLEEPKEEKCRPYRNIDNFITDYCDKKGVEIPSLEYPIIWLKDVNANIARMITEYCPLDNTVRTGDYWSNLQELLENYTYLDGSRCGIKS